MCPRNDESAGKRRSTRLCRGGKRLKTTLIQAAWAAVKVKGSYLQAQFHRIRARRGAKKAIVAVAASMLTAAWHMLRDGTEWQDLGAAHFDRADAARTANRLIRRLQQIGQASGHAWATCGPWKRTEAGLTIAPLAHLHSMRSKIAGICRGCGGWPLRGKTRTGAAGGDRTHDPWLPHRSLLPHLCNTLLYRGVSCSAGWFHAAKGVFGHQRPPPTRRETGRKGAVAR
jgi:hypothetical protein